MLKKLVIGAAAATLLGVFLFGTSFFGYMGTMVDEVKTVANDAVPFEMKIKEAKKKVAGLDDVINQHMVLMAETQADIKGLGEQIAKAEGNLNTQVAQLAKLRELEKQNSEYVSVETTSGQKKFTKQQLTNEIDIRFASYQRGQKGVEVKQKMLEESQKKLADYQKRYNKLITLKEEMQLRIKELEAKKAALDTRKAAEATEYDDSDIQAAQDILDELDRSLEVQGNVLDLKTSSGSGQIDVELEVAPSRDQLDQILEKKDVEPANELISTET